MADTNYNKEYVFFKDITPIIVESDRSSGSGFTNLNRLTTILHSWGFSDVNVSNVTEWKISGKNQYTDQGPRLEWIGNLFVKASGLDLLKCKNKNKTSSQTCTDIQGNDYILLNTHASGYVNADWKWIHISEFGFAMRQDKCYLLSGNRFLNNVTDFMRNPIEDDVDKIVVHEGYYNWKHYSVPFYKINNVLLNAWGDPVSTKTSEKYCFKNHTIYSSYSNQNKKPDKFLFEKIVVKTPWVLSSYFNTTGGLNIYNDVFGLKNNKYYHTRGDTRKDTELVLNETTKVLLYYRLPGTLQTSSADRTSFTVDFMGKDISKGNIRVNFPEQTKNMVIELKSDPQYLIYDLTNAIKQKKNFTLFENSFRNLIGSSIKRLTNTDENYKIFNRFWKPVDYIFSFIEIDKEDFVPVTSLQGYNGSISFHKDFSFSIKSDIGRYSSYWIPVDEDSSISEIQVEQTASATARIAETTDSNNNATIGVSIDAFLHFNGKGFPFSSYQSPEPYYTIFQSGPSTVKKDTQRKYMTKNVFHNYDDGCSWSFQGRNGSAKINTRFFSGYVAGWDAVERQDHYAIVVWDMGRFEEKKGGFIISALEDGGDLYITFENYSDKDVEVTYSNRSDPFSVLSYQTYTYKIGNISEVIRWVPDAHIKYTDPKTNQEVKIYLKDI